MITYERRGVLTDAEAIGSSSSVRGFELVRGSAALSPWLATGIEARDDALTGLDKLLGGDQCPQLWSTLVVSRHFQDRPGGV
jgi:hypothetical protein